MALELSVIVATHNRRDLARRCVASLEEQKLAPGDFEVIVADDGSTDGTADALEALRTPFALRVLRLSKGGQAAAQNAAIEAAEGSVCLFLDDDVVARPELLGEHRAAHRGEASVVGVGRLTQRPPDARDWYAHAFAAAWNSHYDRLEERRLDWTACFGGNLSAPRAALREIGGFATGLLVGEDMELAYRLERHGCSVQYLPQASAVHDDQKGWRQILDDSRRQGLGQLELAEVHPPMRAKLLGWFGLTSRREVVVRRAALALRLPPAVLARLGGLARSAGGREAWFYFVSRYAFWRAVRRNVSRERWEQITWGVPVLMYHAFGKGDERDRYVVPRRALARQLLLLRLLRYRGIRLEELVDDLLEARLPPRRAVVITIDDGYVDNLEVAAPLLRRLAFPATVYLVSGRLGSVNRWTGDGALSGRPLLNWGQVERLATYGVGIGAHTRTHAALPNVADDAVEKEVSGSREELEARLGSPVRTFAYPYGELDDRAVEAVAGAGFAGACTVEPRLAGLDEDPLRVPRIEVRAGESLLRFLVHLWFGVR